MASLFKVSIELAVVLLIATVGTGGWWFLYGGDLPEVGYLSEFAPSEMRLTTDACLPGLSFAVPVDDIAKSFQDALLSAEPESSFSDQIARSLMCNKRESPARYQLDVFRLSWRIRRRFSALQLLTIYANRAYFGPAATGVENASQHFFQKDANSLSAEEAALLTGLLRGPAIFSPFKHPDRALERRNKILETMAVRGRLNATDLAKATSEPIRTRPLGNTEMNPLPSGVFEALAADETEYCGTFDGEFKKGCEDTFRTNLMWVALQVVPRGRPAILIENGNTGFCGSAGCALSLLIEQSDMRFAQSLEERGEVGAINRIAVLRTITNGHYDIQKTWADGKTHTIYRWKGSRYLSD
jgi:Transglycosylase